MAERPELSTPTSGLARALLRSLWDIASTILLALLITLAVNTFVARAWIVDGPSMQPNLYYGERVMIEKVTYRLLHGPRRGDIVVVNVPGLAEPLIKRVVALPGETVEIRGGQVYIDGEPIEEPWVEYTAAQDFPPTTVPPLHVFIIGDNRPNSRDSRAFGPVPVDQIEGRALFIYWPPEHVGTLVDW
ncbi:MAG: signal peptidase I [Anaerolineae bacterium]|nr:signal peptidase I [Anaerolineae bacterium]